MAQTGPQQDIEDGRWWLFPLSSFLLSRAAILTVTAWSLAMDPRLHRPSGPLLLPALEGLCRWDCGWFERLALEGYRLPDYANFFPLFPLLGKGLHWLTGISLPISLVICANAAALAALLVIYRVFEQLEGKAVARVALVLFVSWPFSFFQAAGYPESLMVLSTSLAILLASRGRHLQAGAVLGVGILARHLTVVGGLSLLVAQVRERGFHPARFFKSRAVLGLLLPLAIASLYPLFLFQRFGDPMGWWHARTKGWGEGAWYGVWAFFSGSGWEPQIGLYVLLSLIPGAGAFLLLSKKEWWTLAGYGLGLMLVIWCIGLLGLGRYTGSCWPAFLPLGSWLNRRSSLQLPVILLFASWQSLFLYLYAHSYPIN